MSARLPHGRVSLAQVGAVRGAVLSLPVPMCRDCVDRTPWETSFVGPVAQEWESACYFCAADTCLTIRMVTLPAYVTIRMAALPVPT